MLSVCKLGTSTSEYIYVSWTNMFLSSGSQHRLLFLLYYVAINSLEVHMKITFKLSVGLVLKALKHNLIPKFTITFQVMYLMLTNI